MKQINNNMFNGNRSHINNRTRTEAPTFGDLLRKKLVENTLGFFENGKR
jgi:hypothetical protein